MSFNAASGLSAGIQGAKLGGALGGPWGAVGGGLLGLVLGGKAKDQEKEMAKKYNDQVVKYAAQDLFDMQRQQNVQNTRTAQALASYQDNSRVQSSTVVANMGAADIIGSSAQALIQTMDFQTNAAKAETLVNWETGIENYNTTVDRMTNQRSASLKRNREGGGVDVAGLVSGGVDLYNKFGKGEGAGMLADVRDAWNERDYTVENISNGVRGAGASIMDSFKNVWADSTTQMTTTGRTRSSAIATLNADVQPALNSGGFQTFPIK